MRQEFDAHSRGPGVLEPACDPSAIARTPRRDVLAAAAGPAPGAAAAPSCLGTTPTIVDGPGSNRIQGTQGTT